MRIAWVCNKPPQSVVKAAGIDGVNFGGWLDSTAADLLSMPGNELMVLFLGDGKVEGVDGNLAYASFAGGAAEAWFRERLEVFGPDVVHVWGTEAPHSLVAVRAAYAARLGDSTVVSIQGLVSIYGRYHYAEGMPERVMRNPSFGDFVRRTSLEREQRKFVERGEVERECLRIAKHVIGRTEWDKACVLQVNPGVSYHHCNETLRSEFYDGAWDARRVERHSMFVSQCSYPIKGFHYVLEATALLKENIPDVKLYTTGENVFRDGLRRNLGRNSYQLYLARLIERLGLRENIVFTGGLDAAGMKARYLASNVFVSASTIENSPNSVGEAMLLGCPVVSSCVGGVPDMLEHGREGFLYQTSAPYMLAWYVKRIFGDDELAMGFSKAAHERAARTHDRERNLRDLLDIYDSLTRQRL